MEPFPVFKLGTLLARQLSSPIATRIKSLALRHNWFRQSVMPIGRSYRIVDFYYKLWMLPPKERAMVRKLPMAPTSDQMALDLGGDILGEAVLFGILSAIIIFEVNRQAMIKEDQEMFQKSAKLQLLLSLEELKKEIMLQQAEMEKLIDELQQIELDRGLTPTPIEKPQIPDFKEHTYSSSSDEIVSDSLNTIRRGSSSVSTTIAHMAKKEVAEVATEAAAIKKATIPLPPPTPPPATSSLPHFSLTAAKTKFKIGKKK